MPIAIIGQSAAETPKLPVVEIDLPPPSTAPAGAAVHSTEALLALLDHAEALVRRFALGRLQWVKDPVAREALIGRLGDADERTAASVIEVLAAAKDVDPARYLEPVAERLKTGGGAVVEAGSRALARHGAERLVEIAKNRARLDDQSYAQLIMELGGSRHPAAIEHLEKSMTRAGVMNLDRRTALYTAALRSASDKLVPRVVNQAVSTSASENPEESGPARSAMIYAFSLPPEVAIPEYGAETLRAIREDDKSLLELLPDEDARRAFDQAVRENKLGTAIAIVGAPALDFAIASEQADKAPVARSRAVLDALVKKAAAIDPLIERGALFLAVALEAAIMLGRARFSSQSSPMFVALGKTLELEPAALLAKSDPDLRALFTEKTPREMRRVLNALTSEPVPDPDLVRRFLTAIIAGGHGTDLIETIAEKSEALALVLLGVASEDAIGLEALVLELLDRRPLPASLASLALLLAGRLGTQRLSLAIARRYYDLRKLSRLSCADAVLRIGDPRLLPLVESRAFPDEPEESGFVLLGFLSGAPLEGKLAEAAARVRSGRSEEEDANDARLVLPLACQDCSEEFAYRMHGLFVDPRSKEPHGDPAYIGEINCKACGSERLLPTQMGLQIMSSEMMRFLSEQRNRKPEDPPAERPRVEPRLVRAFGAEVGIAEALRRLDRELASSPGSIRLHLQRGHLRLMAGRSAVHADAEAILALDPKSPEATDLLGHAAVLAGDLPGAMLHFAQALRLARTPDVRLYEGTAEQTEHRICDSILMLENMGIEPPADLALDEARARGFGYDET